MKIKFIKIGRNGIVSWKKKIIKKKILLPEYTVFQILKIFLCN